MPETAPYGSWRSPISAAAIAAGGVSLASVDLVGDSVYWLEGKPLEGGRLVVVRQTGAEPAVELTPAPLSARTRVHEYGGGATLIVEGTVFFSNFVDQRLYRQDGDAPPRPITPDPAVQAGLRYADAQLTPDGQTLICVRESHASATAPDADNELVALPADGAGEARVVASGHDFYAAPRISPDGRQLAWLTWDHPRMPWDGTELWLADLTVDAQLSHPRRVAGGSTESVCQPAWSPAGELHFVSDRTGWWNLYRLHAGEVEALAPCDAEFGSPQWVFGMASYAFLEDGRIAAIHTRDGFDHLGYVAPNGELESAGLPYTAIGRRLCSSGSTLAFIAATPTEGAAVIRLETSTGTPTVLRQSQQVQVDPRYISSPRPIAFPTPDPASDSQAYAMYYAPVSAEFSGPPDERPPLIVMSHGGPTSMTQAAFSLSTQYWTSRGFGVVDVNYGGSSGYGRPYRERLNGQWGIVDTADCIAAAQFLVAAGEVDGARLAIRGGSAGGYTTLCALVFHDTFAAGASYYGVADCEALATDTHKFEARYLDGLIGPYPAARDLYVARSPIHLADQLSCPLILFQGLEDRVVPPNQAERMVAALRARRLPVAYLEFAGEQHGFRQASTIQRTLEAELYFYARVFGFPLADDIEPVEIENLP